MRSIDGKNIRAALRALGDHLQTGRNVDILIVGGAAGVLLGELPAVWTTADVDLIDCHLPADREAVLHAAEAVGRRMGLPASWLSDDVGLFAWALPANWRRRRKLIDVYGRLRVYSVSRIDLICMKFIAHRERDLEHLVHRNVTGRELGRVARYLDRLTIEHRNQRGRIDMARSYAASWQVK